MCDQTEVISISSGSVASVHCPDVTEGFYVQHEDPEVKVEPGFNLGKCFLLCDMCKKCLYTVINCL
jgi:hypothetical protein